VEYLCFARILVLCRSIQSTNPIKQLYTSVYSVYSCLIGIVDLIGGHSAMNLEKNLSCRKKTISIIAHLCSEMAVFGQKSVLFLPSGFRDRFDTQGTKHVFRSYLRNQTTAHREYLMGSTVNNLVKF
jgi:hypothetical protein